MKLKYEIKMKKKYKRNLKLLKKRGKDINLLTDVVFQLANGIQLEPKYNDHKLHGKYSDCRECHIEPDWLLIYKIEDNKLILTLTNTGTHSDLF